MDPNANLNQQRKLVDRLNEAFDDGDEIQAHDVMELVALVEGLDAWFCNGGFLPKAWQR